MSKKQRFLSRAMIWKSRFFHSALALIDKLRVTYYCRQRWPLLALAILIYEPLIHLNLTLKSIEKIQPIRSLHETLRRAYFMVSLDVAAVDLFMPVKS